MLSFKPRQVNKSLLLVLSERNRDIVMGRFGLGDDAQKKTLESIGGRYGITRERVRQIENFSLASICKSSVYEKNKNAFLELKDLLLSLGALVSEEHFLNYISKDEAIQNHVQFLLIIGDQFNKRKEDDCFRHRWVVDEELSDKVHKALLGLHGKLSHNDLVAQSEIFSLFSRELVGVPDSYKKEEILEQWLNLSKVVGKNMLGEWGLASSPNVKARGVRDYAYLVIRKHGSPLHFTEIAKLITKLFERQAHVATCHNELIKDKDRFVLVGRGLYGLKEWGYSDGIVRDVIMSILKSEGPLTRDELVEKVLRERHVKENTVIVNLRSDKHFKRDENGRYNLA